MAKTCISMKELLEKSDEEFFKIQITENIGDKKTVWRNFKRETIEAFVKIQEETCPN